MDFFPCLENPLRFSHPAGTFIELINRMNKSKQKNIKKASCVVWFAVFKLAIFKPGVSPAARNYCEKPQSELWRQHEQIERAWRRHTCSQTREPNMKECGQEASR